tara:strand:+ start:48 stop:587 length:540 start_codon:yes stop_codon:yes gene_type:complete
MENFIYTFQVDTTACDELIQYHKDNTEYKNIGTAGDGSVRTDIKESVDVSFYNNSNSLAIKKYFTEIQKGYTTYVQKFNIGHFQLQTETHNIQYYPPGGGFKVWHYERTNETKNRQLVYMTYLNDVTDDGGTEWLYQDVKLQPKKGLSVIWPSDFAWTHRGIVSPTQEKWIVTGWFSYS